MGFATSVPKLGTDFTKTYVDGKFQHTLGDEIIDSAGTTYKFVRFTAAKTKGLIYMIDHNFTLGSASTTALTSTAPFGYGVPQTDLTAPNSDQTYSYGFVAIKGPMVLLDVTLPSADIELYTSSITGITQSNVGGGKAIDGLKFTSAATTVSAIRNAFSYLPLGMRTDA